MIAGDYFAQHIELLAQRGRLTHIATSHGAAVELDLRKVMQRRLVITGSTLRSRPIPEKGELRDAIEAQLWPHIISGEIKPLVDRTFPLADAAEAHRYFSSGQHSGKVLLICSAEEEKKNA